MKYEAENCYEEAPYDANFSYGIEIRINLKSIRIADVNLFEDNENMKFLISL